MLGLVFLLTLITPSVEEVEGKVRTLYGRDFGFQILEPSGWVLDTRSAPQIANFILHPVGVDWRRSRTVVFVRFIRRQAEEELQDLIKDSREGFEVDCPFADEPVEQDVEDLDFDIELLNCPGFRTELVAAKEVPGFFLVLSLASPSSDDVESGRDVFLKILRSFEWIPLPVSPRPRIAPSKDPENESPNR